MNITVPDFLVYRIKRVEISIFFVLRILHQTTQSKFQSMTDPKKMEKVSKICSNTEKYDIKIVSFWAENFFEKQITFAVSFISNQTCTSYYVFYCCFENKVDTSIFAKKTDQSRNIAKVFALNLSCK